MNQFNPLAIMVILLFVFATVTLLKDIYAICNSGEFIVKVKESRGLAIIWIILLIVWIMFFFFDIYDKNKSINDIFMHLFWIEFSISSIIKSLVGSEIRENGIYYNGYFYKWGKAENYSWTSPNTIKFKVNTFLQTKRTFQFTIKEEFKSEVEEVVQRNFVL